MAMTQAEYARRVQEQRERMYRLAYCYVKNAHDAMDIVSEAVYRGLVRLHQLRDPQRFELWMNRIVVNAALDLLRKKPWEELPEELPETASLPAEETMDLYQALDLLPPEERSYIILRFFQERSFREMAEILQVPETTVKSRVYRILERLRRRLEIGGRTEWN